MPSLEHLVEHYQLFKDGLPTTLIYPAQPPMVPSPPPVIDFNTIRKTRQHSLPSPSTSPMSLTSMATALPPPKNAATNTNTVEKPQKQQKPSPIKAIITDGFRSFRRNKSTQNTASDIKAHDLKLEFASSPLTNLSFKSDFHLDQLYQSPKELPAMSTTTDAYLVDDKAIRNPNSIDLYKNYSNLPGNIPRTKINIVSELGKGEFGCVYRGLYTHNQSVIHVAVKKLPENHTNEDRMQFFREAQFMMELHHPCIVRLIGVCMVSRSIVCELHFNQLVFFL